MSYHNDFRVRSSREASREHFDETDMTIAITIVDDEGNEVELSLPARFTVCPTCGGKGKHVNPSIDCDGLTESDFHDDPEFRESYFAGTYDVTCYRCNGTRVIGQVDRAQAKKADLNQYDEYMRQCAADDREHEAELRYGC